MVSRRMVAVIGAAGVIVGYVAGAGVIGKPKITISGNTWTYSGFPALVPLMGMGGGTGGIGSAPVNLGGTDAKGTLVLTGMPAVPAGNTVLYIAFVATDPAIYATSVVKF